MWGKNLTLFNLRRVNHTLNLGTKDYKFAKIVADKACEIHGGTLRYIMTHWFSALLRIPQDTVFSVVLYHTRMMVSHISSQK